MNSVPMNVECIQSEKEAGEKQQLVQSNGMRSEYLWLKQGTRVQFPAAALGFLLQLAY